MRPYYIVLADDYSVLRYRIKEIINNRKDMLVVGEAGDGIELLDLLQNILFDLVILDISMPRLCGIKAAHKIKTVHPNTKILILSMHNSSNYVEKVFAAGVNGYLLKEDLGDELFIAIEKIREGQLYFSPSLL